MVLRSGPSNAPGGKGIGGRLVKSPWPSLGSITEGACVLLPSIRSRWPSPSTSTSAHVEYQTCSDATSGGRLDEILVKEVPSLFSRKYGPIQAASEPRLPTYMSR